MPKTNLDELHATIAREIKYAKRAMFKRNREGANPRESYLAFMGNIGVEIANIVFPPKPDQPDYVTATLPDGQEVELHGDAVDLVAEYKEIKREALAAQKEFLAEDVRARAEYIEKLATTAAAGHSGGSDPDQQLALLTLLNEIESSGHSAADDALVAKYAALKASFGLHDDAIEYLVKGKGATQ